MRNKLPRRLSFSLLFLSLFALCPRYLNDLFHRIYRMSYDLQDDIL